MGTKLSVETRAKRKLLSERVWDIVYGCERGAMQLNDLLRGDAGTDVHRDNVMRQAFTGKERRLIQQRIDAIRKPLGELRVIARHLDQTSRG